jgi:pRiA4b ORF-3-like protein
VQCDGASPLEDCGGVPGYEEFLEAIRDATHRRHHELLDSVSGEFDPEAFDRDQVNRALKRYT